MRRATTLIALLVAIAGIYYVGVMIHLRYFWRPDVAPLVSYLVTCAAGVSSAAAEARNAVDVIVRQDVSGALVISGKAVQGSPLQLRSREELAAFLGALPRGGTAIVEVVYTTPVSGVQGLLVSPPPSVREAETDLIGVLATHGFHAQHSNRDGSPCTVDGSRPTRR